MKVEDIYQPDEYGDPEDILTATIKENPTEAGIKHLINAREALDKMIKERFWERYYADPEWREGFIARPSIDSIEFGNVQVSGEYLDAIEINCSCRACNRGCCGTDYHTYRMPLSDLWRDRQAVLDEVAAEIKERERLALEKKQQEEAEEKRKWEAAERAQLKALAEKYPEELEK